MKKFIFILITIFLLAASSAQGARHHPKKHKHHTTSHHIAKYTSTPISTTSEPSQKVISEPYEEENAMSRSEEETFEIELKEAAREGEEALAEEKGS